MSIPETQKDLLAYLDRITRKLGSTRGGRTQNRLDYFTTASITDSLAISRSLASQYLNELVRAGLVVKAGARPVCYFHRRSLERFFQSRIERSTYPSVEQLFATLGNGERLDFDRAVGHELSLAPCIGQLCAALKYPPAGLPILLCGASGTGKELLAELALEYGKNAGILRQEAELASIDCSHYADDARALVHDLRADDGPASQARGGIVYLKDVDALSPVAQEALMEWASTQVGAVSPNPSEPATRLIFASSHEADSAECCGLARRIPMTAQVPPLRERTQEEREELTLHFLKEEGRRMGLDILISRSAFRKLATTNFEENVRGLRDCITNCCAEAYLDTKGDRLEIRTYQLPSAILAGSTLERSENDTQLIDTTRSVQSQADDRARHVLDAMLEPYESYRAGTLDGSACSAQLVERARDLEDYLAFGQNPGRSKSDAYEQIADGVVASVNELYSIDLSRKSSHLIAQGICLQLWPPASLSRWKSSHAGELAGMRGVVAQRNRFAATACTRIADELESTLGIALDDLTYLLVLAHAALSLDPSRRRRSVGIVLSHGYSTATSIADAANRILGTRVFEAIDMPYDQQVTDVVVPLQQIIDRFSYADEVVILVDMGSLQDIYKSLESTSGMTLGIINNASTGLAVEVGARLIAGHSVREVLDGAATACTCSYHVVARSARPDAIVFCSEGGLDAAARIRDLVAQSLPDESPARLVAVDWRQLANNGSEDAAFSQYDVRSIIGTDNPHVDGVPFISLEELIAGEGTARIDRAFARLLDADSLRAFHQNLVKNMTLRNVVESITILNPNKLFGEIESAVERLQQLTGDVIGARVSVGLYVHLCCLVERLVTRSPIETYADEVSFSVDHADFIEAFRKSFADISAHYHVDVPITEIAYAYDYVSSSHAPRTRATSHTELEDTNDWN